MSINADTMRILFVSGFDTEEAILGARAMERGPDRDTVFGLIDEMRRQGAPDADIGAPLVALFNQIIERHATMDARWMARERDYVPDDRDSNRRRRGMKDSEWRVLRVSIFERDGFECQYCGRRDDLTCDHVVPLVRGGSNDIDNLTTACRSCNSSKSDKLLEEWLA